MLKVAIVGCGKIADGHAEEINKIDSAKCVAVCDLESILAEQFGLRYGVPHWYTDIDRMLSEQQPDVIHIATPPQSHLVLTQKAALAGCHVFLEKPLALNAKDGRCLIECMQQARRKMTINYWNDFESPAMALKEFVSKGELGDPVHIESYYGYDMSEAFGQALLADSRHWVHQLPGKLFQNVIDHAISKITPFLQDGNFEVIARAYQRDQSSFGSGNEIPDELRVMILGRTVSAYVTFCSNARPVGHFLRVYGTKNTAHVDYRFRSFYVEETQSVPSAVGRLIPPFKSSWQYLRQATHNTREFGASRFHYFAGLSRLLARFYESVERNTPPPIPYSEILRASEIMDEIFAQVCPGVPA